MKYMNIAIVMVLLAGGFFTMGMLFAYLFGWFSVVASAGFCAFTASPIFNVLQAYWGNQE